MIADGANSPQAREAVSRWFAGGQTPTGDQILAVQEFIAARETKDLKCPQCGAALEPQLVKKLAGKVVGSITGKRKARSPPVARAAARTRWKRRQKPQPDAGGSDCDFSSFSSRSHSAHTPAATL